MDVRVLEADVTNLANGDFLVYDSSSGLFVPSAISGTGIVVKNGAGSFITRTLTGAAAGVLVTNGNGVAGNPTLSLGNDLAALEAMSGTGLVARTGSETYAQRSIAVTYPLYPRLDIVSNADGSAGDPTLDLSSTTLTGWWTLEASASYASSTTFTYTTANTRLSPAVGDKVYMVQNTGTKYFYVIGVSGTTTKTITVTGGSDYAVDNSPISVVRFSKNLIANDHPDWFNWSPTLVGFSSNPTNTCYRFKLTNRLCTTVATQNTNGTSNATNFTISSPIQAANITNAQWGGACIFAFDNGAILNSMATVAIVANATVFNVFPSPNQAGWTAANGKRASFVTHYEI